jgi:hypothetical protein
MAKKKIAATFRLTDVALSMLRKLAERGGITMTAVIETLIRQAAKKEMK